MQICPKCRSIYRMPQAKCGIDGTRLVEQPNDPLIGTMVDRYEITARLGAGGMAAVYRARHKNLGTEHALKVLWGDFASNREIVERFSREARSVATMRHRNIIAVTD